jgi:hypothetical protein
LPQVSTVPVAKLTAGLVPLPPVSTAEAQNEAMEGVYAHNDCVEDQMEPWRVCRPMVADLHHFDKD